MPGTVDSVGSKNRRGSCSQRAYRLDYVERLISNHTDKCEMTTGISVINIVLYEQLDMGIKVECHVGERKTFKAQEQHKKGSGRRNLVYQGPSKRVRVAGQRGNMVMKLKRWVRPDRAGPHGPNKDLSLYPEATGSPQNVFSKTC